LGEIDVREDLYQQLRWYKVNLTVLLDYRPLASSKLDAIGGELVAELHLVVRESD